MSLPGIIEDICGDKGLTANEPKNGREGRKERLAEWVDFAT